VVCAQEIHVRRPGEKEERDHGHTEMFYNRRMKTGENEDQTLKHALLISWRPCVPCASACLQRK